MGDTDGLGGIRTRGEIEIRQKLRQKEWNRLTVSSGTRALVTASLSCPNSLYSRFFSPVTAAWSSPAVAAGEVEVEVVTGLGDFSSTTTVELLLVDGEVVLLISPMTGGASVDVGGADIFSFSWTLNYLVRSEC